MFGLTLHSGTTATKCELVVVVVLVVAVTFSQQISSLTRVHVGVSSAEEARGGQRSRHHITSPHNIYWGPLFRCASASAGGYCRDGVTPPQPQIAG